jgi:O-antigen/teichoic acid export membrane protein
MKSNKQNSGTTKNIIYSYGSVVISTLLSLITVPLAVNYFGKNTYGLFSITADTIAYLTLFNFGIPWASATIFAKLVDYARQKELIKKSIILLLFFSGITVAGLALFHLFFSNWINFIANINTQTLIYAKTFIIISVIFFVIRMPFSLFSQLMIFINKVYIARIIDIVSGFFSFISLLLTIHFKLTIVDYAVINGLMSLLPLIACVTIFLHIWKQHNKFLVNKKEVYITYSYLISSSFYFFLNGIGGLIIWNTDSIVIAHYLGLNNVTEYAMLFKVFSILFMIITQLMGVVNPLFPKLQKENKQEVLSDLYNVLLKLFPIIGGLIFIAIFGFFKDFLYLWTHNNNIFIGYLSCFAMGMYCYFLCSSIVPYSVIVSLNYAKVIYKLTLLEALINLVISIILVQKIGIAGVIFATLIAHILTMFLLVPGILDKLIPHTFKFDYKYILLHLVFAVIPTIFIISYINQLTFGYIKVILLLFFTLIYISVSFYFLGKNKLIKYINLIKIL